MPSLPTSPSAILAMSPQLPPSMARASWSLKDYQIKAQLSSAGNIAKVWTCV